MLVYSELQKAYFESLSSAPSTELTTGRFYYNTSSTIVQWYTGAAWKTGVDTDTSQTMSNKSVTELVVDGAADNGDAYIHFTHQSSDAATPGSGTNHVRLFAKSKKLYTSVDNGSGTAVVQEVGSGSGAGGINYISNYTAETDTTGWSTYEDTGDGSPDDSTPADGTGGTPNVTWTKNTTTPLRSDADFKFLQDAADRQGEGVSYDFTIDRADLNKKLWISFDVDATDADYVAGDLAVYVYDKDNATLITPASTSISAAKYTWTTSFNATDADDYRLIIHVAQANTSGYSVYFDNFKVGPQELIQGTPISDWVSFSPSTTWTTNTTWNGYYRRVGDSMEMRVTAGLTGVPDTATLTLTLPNSLSMDTTKIRASNTMEHLGTTMCHYSGGGNPYHAAQAYYNTSTTIGFRYPTGDRAANITESLPAAWGSGDTFDALIGPIPIAEWSGASVGLSNTRVEYASTDSTWNADSSSDGSDSSYGTDGAQMSGSLTTARSKYIRWLTPPQATDQIKVQVKLTQTDLGWQDVGDTLPYDGSNAGVRLAGTDSNGITKVIFRQYLAGTNNWTNAYSWRVVKCSNPLSVAQPLLNKWQKKTLTSGTISSTTASVADLGFSGLTIGQTYRVILSAEVIVSGNSATEQMQIACTNDGNNVAILTARGDQGSADSKGLFASAVGVFTATAATLVTSVSESGTGTVSNGATVIVEELPYHIATTDW